MENTDTYKTIEHPALGLYKEKGSKFISFAYPVSSETEIREIIGRIKKEHHSARHHCFAWQIRSDKPTFRINDDGEPSGTAGRPIYSQIQHHDLTDILIIVVRYFGGILLGTSGLINAYKQAAADVLAKSEIVEKIIETTIEINFDYQSMNEVMLLLKDFKLEMTDSRFDLVCSIKVSVRKQLVSILLEKLGKIENLKLTYL